MIYSDCIWPGPGAGTRHSPGSTRRRSRSFAQGIRRRYTDEQILEQLRASAARLGRSPTMREFAADPEARHASADGDRALRHVERREAGSRPDAAPLHQPRRAARPAPAARRGARPDCRRRAISTRTAAGMASKSLIWHTFGSLTRRAAGSRASTCPSGTRSSSGRSRRGGARPRQLGRLPRMADWKEARRERRGTDVRVAGLPARRHRLGPVGCVPVPRARAPARGGRRPCTRTARWPRLSALARLLLPSISGCLRGEAGELREARGALVRRAHRRQHAAPRDTSDRGGIAPRSTIRPRSRREQPPLGDLVLAQRAAGARPRRPRARTCVEAKNSSRRARPIQSGRPTPRARCSGRRDALVDPGGRHRAAQLLERRGSDRVSVHEGEDRLGVDRHLGLGPLDARGGRRSPRR